ncbi:hypothetical protein QE152_g36779 [Popillia japonica]|uniref:Uncharacterized protein n=1 Tax=Popillia japonica TaxID=7064 RepID=A0AAW1ICV4_POPJA
MAVEKTGKPGSEQLPQKSITVCGGLPEKLEHFLFNVPVSQRDRIRAKATYLITNFSHNPFFKSPSISTPIEKEVNLFLKQNPNILITRADKGNTTVAIDRDSYHYKSLELLSDPTTYKVLPKDPTLKIERKNNFLNNKLKATGHLT